MPLEQCADENDLVDFVAGRFSPDRSSLLDRHLTHCSRCREMLVEIAKPETECASRPLEAKSGNGNAHEVQVGSLIGRYVVLGKAGAGAMGVVYAAYDPELDRKVAIKVLRTLNSESFPCEANFPSAGSVATLRERLLLEAKALARLSHPNVLNVYDVGTFDDQVFIAMEFIQGSTFREWLAAAPRTLNEVLDALISAGEGLAAAHRAGLVHRDFKPDNVMVGDDGRVRVTDFGLARAIENSRPDGEAYRPILIGTPIYMAPKQLMGRPADFYSDQYSFCVALYEAIWGRFPHRGMSVQELTKSKATTDLESALSERRVPSRVRKAVLKGLSPEPTARHPSMKELLNQLKKRSTPWVLPTAAAASLLILAAVVAGTYRQVHVRQLICKGAERKLTGIWDESSKARMRAAFAATNLPYEKEMFLAAELSLSHFADQWVAMHTEACEATRLRGEQSEALLDRRMSCLEQRLNELDAVVQVFENADARTVEQARSTTSALAPLRSCADIEALNSKIPMPQDPQLRKKIEEQRKALAHAHAQLFSGHFSEALQEIRPVAAVARSLSYLPLQGEAAYYFGVAQFRNGEYPEAQSSFMNSLMMGEASHEDRLVAEASIYLSRVTGHELRQFEVGEMWQQHAEAVIQRMGGSDELMARLLSTVASIQAERGAHEQALDTYQRGLVLLQRLYGAKDLDVADALDSIGNELMALGRTEEAETSYRRSLAVMEGNYGPEHPLLGAVYVNLFEPARIRRDANAMLQASERALTIFRKTLRPNHPYIAAALTNASVAYSQLGRHRDAINSSAEALGMALDAGMTRGVSEFIFNHAQALAGARRFKEALAEYQKALALEEKSSIAPSSLLTRELTGLGQVWLALARPAKAVAPLDRAFRLQPPTSTGSLDLADTEFFLAQALWDTNGNNGRALELASAARAAWKKNRINPERETAITTWLARHFGHHAALARNDREN